VVNKIGVKDVRAMDIREEFSRLSAIVKTNLIGTFSMDLNSGIMQFSPEAAEKMSIEYCKEIEGGQCVIHYDDFIMQVHIHDKTSARKAFARIFDGTWAEEEFLAFRFPSALEKYEWLSIKVVYEREMALGGITDYSANMRLHTLSTLALEGASKYTFYYDFKTGKIAFNDEFVNDYAIHSNPVDDGLNWLATMTTSETQKEEIYFAMRKINANESDTVDLKLRIYDGHSKALRWLHLRGKCSRNFDQSPDMLAGSILDITHQVRNEELNSLIIEGSSDCVFVFDLEKDIFEFSSKIYDLVPLRSRKMQNGMETWLNFIVPHDRPAFTAAIDKIMTGETDNFKVEFRLKGRESSPFWVACSGKCSTDEKGTPILIAGSLINLDTMSNYSQYMDEAMNANRSSGLPNRAAFYQDLETIIDEAIGREPETLGHIIMIDIDGFGSINSLHGLLIGDRMLMEYGALLAMLVPFDGKLYHFGNNLFVVYIKQTRKEPAQKLAEQIRNYSSSGLLVGDIHLMMTVSLGVAGFNNEDKVEDVLVNAELALRRAKEIRNSVDYFEAEYRKTYLERLSLEAELSDCINDDFRGFEVFYQPFYSISLNAFIGAEALLRWRDSDGKIVSPGAVIPALQSMGVFNEVESWIFRTSAEQCAKWKIVSGHDDFVVNVNMSPQRAASGGLTDEVREVMARYDLQMYNMFLELTEEGIIMSSQSNVQTLKELRQLGARISLDDFGTGYSSLGHLRHLPVCELKIDRSFVIDIENSETGREFLGALINLAHIMNYVVCVEGVENLEQLRILVNLNADIIQGFYFSPPIPAERFEKEFILPNDCEESFSKRYRDVWGVDL
jgi:diguanylate cyclase (GGDEF)-like protein